MTHSVPIDMTDISITPVFKMMDLENIPKSEAEGRKVMETREVVELRFAGSKDYSPVMPTDAVYERQGHRAITFAERWPEQYRAFKEGNPQEAGGTPLEVLQPYGITPELISLCRVLRIYSVEALDALESRNLKSLGMHGNKLKDAARDYLASRVTAADALDEIAALRAKIAEMESRSTLPPVQDSTPDEIAAAEAAADASGTVQALKAEIKAITGQTPKGNPSEETLRGMLAELQTQ